MTKRIILVIFVLFMLVLPIILVFVLSNAEKEKYKPDDAFVYTESSYGIPEKFERRNLPEYYIVNGSFVSGKALYQDLGSSSADAIRVLVSAGDEISIGDILGTVNGVPVISKYNGIIRNISLISDKDRYVVLDSTDEILLSSKLASDIGLKKGIKYKNENNETVELVFISKQIDDSKRLYNFRISGTKNAFGERITMKVFTGYVYENVLTVSSRAVYKKSGSDKYFIRRVYKDGLVAGECEVIPGYEGDGYISVTGADDSWYCDPAYGALVDVKGNK